jgi:hypothetical protein
MSNSVVRILPLSRGYLSPIWISLAVYMELVCGVKYPKTKSNIAEEFDKKYVIHTSLIQAKLTMGHSFSNGLKLEKNVLENLQNWSRQSYCFFTRISFGI